MIPTLDLISPVMESRENTPVLSVFDYVLSGVVMTCLLGFMACPDSKKSSDCFCKLVKE